MQGLNILMLFLLSIYQVRAEYYSLNQECCKCPEPEVNKNVNNNIQIGRLSKDKQELLDLQNQYRREVAEGRVPNQPASSKIKDLVCSIQ